MSPLTLPTLAQVGSLPDLECPPDDLPKMWRAQVGWRAMALKPPDWQVEIPSSLANEIAERARCTSLCEALATWESSREMQELSEYVEQTLEQGIGFLLLRGLPVSGVSDIDERMVLLFGLMFGKPVSQTRNGNLVARIEDLGHDLKSPNVRGHQTAAELAFHCDRADRVMLSCIRPARLGGRSRIVSSIALDQILRDEAPELAARLSLPLPQDRRGEQARGDKSYSMLPIFSRERGAFIARYLRRFIHDSQRHLNAPRLTPTDIAALDSLDALFEREGLVLDMPFAQGDVQILNNNVVMHARTAFSDYTDPERRRLLLRLWLAHKSSRPLPPSFVDLYGCTCAGTYRGGVWPKGTLPINTELPRSWRRFA